MPFQKIIVMPLKTLRTFTGYKVVTTRDPTIVVKYIWQQQSRYAYQRFLKATVIATLSWSLGFLTAGILNYIPLPQTLEKARNYITMVLNWRKLTNPNWCSGAKLHEAPKYTYGLFGADVYITTILTCTFDKIVCHNEDKEIKYRRTGVDPYTGKYHFQPAVCLTANGQNLLQQAGVTNVQAWKKISPDAVSTTHAFIRAIADKFAAMMEQAAIDLVEGYNKTTSVLRIEIGAKIRPTLNSQAMAHARKVHPLRDLAMLEDPILSLK